MDQRAYLTRNLLFWNNSLSNNALSSGTRVVSLDSVDERAMKCLSLSR